MHFLLNPLTWLFTLLILVWLFNKLEKSTLLKVTYWGIVLWVLIIFISPAPKYFLHSLEKQYKPLNEVIETSKPLHIIVLGGGSNIDPALPWVDQLSATAKGRLMEGLRQYQIQTQSRLILSGHSSTDRTSIAEIMGNTAVSLGIDPSDTLLSTQAGNTLEEAHFYAQRFGNSATLILVTDASHMPRAIKAFQLAGINAHAAPTNFKINFDPLRSPFRWKPSLEKINFTQSALKEWIGKMYLEF